MAYVGSEIVQSRIWIDPDEKPVPLLNYKLTYPITVFDAVRRDMDDENSQTLTEALESIQNGLAGKQDILPAKPANNIVTYGGIAGAVGSIEITTHIPYDIDVMSDEKIPTEKAIGRLFQDYGIIPGEGHIPDVVLWKDVVGRPTIYDAAGDDPNGVISQAGLNTIFNNIDRRINNVISDMDSTPLAATVRNHISNYNNPHNITPAAIGAISISQFENHTLNANNPHHVTASQIGLGKVNNTSDLDKPISRSTQAALDQINVLISNITGLIGDIRYVVNIEYTQSSGRLNVTYNDGSEVGVTIITDGLIDDIIPDPENHAIIVQELNGTQTSIDLQQLITSSIGSEGTHIEIVIDDDNTIHANIIPKSIKATEIADGSLINSLFAFKTISGDKIQDLTITTRNLGNGIVTADKIADGAIDNGKIAIHSLTGHNLFTTNIPNSVLMVRNAGEDASWGRVTGDMVEASTITGSNIVSNTIGNDHIRDNAITSSKIQNDAVTAAKIANGSISAVKMQAGTITGSELANDIVLPGTPTLANTPVSEALGKEIVDAAWVRNAIASIDVTVPDRSILGRHLFTSAVKNRVLAVLETNADPVYSQINSEMIVNNSITTAHIVDGAITAAKLVNDIITADKIASNSVTSIKIAEGEVKSINLFPSEDTHMVLGVDNVAGHPIYTKVTSEMITRDAITNAKIQNYTITADKLNPPDTNNVVLMYTDDNSAPVWDKINGDMILNRSITGEKMFSSAVPNMVLTVGDSNTAPTWAKITDAMIGQITLNADNIVDGSISGDKIGPNAITNPKMAPNSVTGSNIQSDTITPDKIKNPNVTGRVLGIATGGDTIDWITIDTRMITDQSITSSKLWLSDDSYVVLGSVNSNASPDYQKLNENWFLDKAFSSRKLADSLTLFGSPTLNQHPAEGSNDHTIADTAWVNTAIREAIEAAGGFVPYPYPTPPEILPDGCVTESKIVNEAVTSEKIKDFSIGPNKFKAEALFTTVHIYDNSVTTNKLANKAVTGSKIATKAVTTTNIADGAVTSNKLADNLTLPKNSKVDGSDNDVAVLRNVMVSPNLPTGCTSGEIWLQYAT